MPAGTPPLAADLPLAWGTPAARRTLAATIVASGVAFLDSSVVTVALPRMGDDLGGGFSTLQWILDGYLLTLGALVLVGGALGDLLGKRRVFLWGIAGFGLTSLLCAVAPTASTLVVGRLLQGVAAALLVPGSLAILSASFAGADRGRAIGAWSGLGGLFTAAGPVLGGLLVESVSWGWRAIFLINPPLLAVAWWLTRTGVAELPGRRRAGRLAPQLDLPGAGLAVMGLGLIVYPLIEAGSLAPAAVIGLVALGVALLVGFVAVEARSAYPMLPPSLFKIRTFAVANLVTLVVYGALGAAFFLLIVHVQTNLGYSAAVAGLTGLPVTIVLGFLSARVGALVPVVGPRILLTLGPLIMGAALLLLGGVRPGSDYWMGIVAPMTLFAVGLVLVVAPVTTTALIDVPADRSGAASGTNNAIARVASLLAIAVLPLAGTAGGAAVGSVDAFSRSMVVAAVLCALGGVVALVGLPARVKDAV